MTTKKDWIGETIGELPLGSDEATDEKVVLHFIQNLHDLGFIKIKDTTGSIDVLWHSYRKGML